MRKESKLDKRIGSRRVKVDAKAAITLRTLRNEEAFYFYEEIGKPTGESARSLRDFLGRIESVKLESLIFHLKRNDIKNWIENTLKDSTLAKKLERIPAVPNDRLRAKICSTVRNRLKELEVTSEQVTIYVEQPSTITA